MKVRIITLHDAINYGAALQAYALCKKIKCLDAQNNVAIIDLEQKKYIPSGFKERVIYGASNFFDLFHKKEIRERKKKFYDFIHQKLELTEHYDNAESLKSNPPEADVYITGSDQVWNCSLTLRDEYYLNFGSAKKVSYAASIGVDYIPERFQKSVIEYLSDFDCISVREKSAQKIVGELLKKDCEITLDPTLLLSRENWEELIEKPIVSGDYILYYHLHSSKTAVEMLKILKRRYNAKIVTVTLSSKPVFGDVVIRDAGPLDFLNLYRYAIYTVNSSFHGTAFSVIFNKSFNSQIYGNSGDRVKTLLSTIGLEDRIFTDSELPKAMGEFEYDGKFHEKLEEEKEKSEKFLRNALK